jgi:hypothetical protein
MLGCTAIAARNEVSSRPTGLGAPEAGEVFDAEAA